MNILFNTLCIFLEVGFRAFPLAFQSFVEDGFFIQNKHWPEQKCPDTHGVRLQSQFHRAGSHCDPYVSLPGASSVGPFAEGQSANSQRDQIGFAEHSKAQSGLEVSAEDSDFAGFMRECFPWPTLCSVGCRPGLH